MQPRDVTSRGPAGNRGPSVDTWNDSLESRRLRAVGDAARRFAEDGLRVLRAARFVATLEFELDAATASAIRPSLASYRQVSAERIRDEWNKALRAREPSRAFAVMSVVLLGMPD